MKIENVKQEVLNFITGDYGKFQKLSLAQKAAIVGLRVMGSAGFMAGIGLAIAAPVYVALKGIGLIGTNVAVAGKVAEIWATGAIEWIKMTAEFASMGGDIGGFAVLFLGGMGVILFGAPLILPVIPGILVSAGGGLCLAESYQILDYWSDSLQTAPNSYS